MTARLSARSLVSTRRWMSPVPEPHGFIVTTRWALSVRSLPLARAAHRLVRAQPGAGFIDAIVGAVLILTIYRVFFGGPT